MEPGSPALAAARALARCTGTEITPVDREPPRTDEPSILLVDHAPDEVLLSSLRQALDQCSALVLWAPGWDEAVAVDKLARYGFEHGSVDILSIPQRGALAVLTASADAADRIARHAGRRQQRDFRVLAIVPAHNEVDVIHHSIGAIVSQGVDVYLIDHESTDGTAEAAAPWLGRGLVGIERFPDDAGYAERNRGTMVWREILTRVQELTGEIEADWYLFHNPDEFREAPWPGVTLADALREVDELGYSAVNFELFDFRPTDESFHSGADPRRHLRHYDRPGRHDVLQIKAWKRQAQPVDLVHHGGHDVLFEGKRVFPVPFILRHYPIRSSEHGARKVMAERLPRFASEERAGGWHVQYDEYIAGKSYLHDPRTLSEWDGLRVRAELLAERMRDLLLVLCLGHGDPAGNELRLAELSQWLLRRGQRPDVGAQLYEAQERVAAAARGMNLADAPELDRIARELSLAFEAHARVRGDVLTAAALGDARDRLDAPRPGALGHAA